MECNKNGHLFIIYFLLQMMGLLEGTYIDCNGKAFHCMNSTHFKICVDLGGGVSKTVDEFLIPCPPLTFCKETNYFECEYEVTTTSISTNRHNEVNKVTQYTDVPNVLDVNTIIPFPYVNEGVMLERLYSTISTPHIYDNNSETPVENTTPSIVASDLEKLSTVNNQNIDSEIIYNGTLTTVPIITVFTDSLITAKEVLYEVVPANTNMEKVDVTEQANVLDIIPILTFPAIEIENNNALNLSITKKNPTTIHYNPSKLNKDVPIENINQTYEGTFYEFSSQINTTQYDKMNTLSNSINLRFKIDSNVTEEKISRDNFSRNPVTVLNYDQNDNHPTGDSTRDTSIASKLSSKKFISTNTNNSIFLTLSNTTEMITASYFLANEELSITTSTPENNNFQLLLNQSNPLSENLNATVANTTRSFKGELKRNYSDEKITVTRPYMSEKPTYPIQYTIEKSKALTTPVETIISTTSSPLLQDTLMELRDVHIINTNKTYSSGLEISTQKYLDHALSTATDYVPTETSVNNKLSSISESSNQNLSASNVLQDIEAGQEIFTQINTEQRNNQTYLSQNSSNALNIIPYLHLSNYSIWSSVIRTKTFINKEADPADKLSSTTDYDNSVINEISTTNFINEAQEITTADYQLNKNNNLYGILSFDDMHQPESHTTIHFTQQNNISSFTLNKQTTLSDQKTVTKDTYNENVTTENSKYEIESEHTIGEMSVDKRVSHKLLPITTPLQYTPKQMYNVNMNTTSHYFTDVEANTEKYIDVLSTVIDTVPTNFTQTNKISVIRELVNISMKSIFDFPQQNETNLGVTKTEFPVLKNATISLTNFYKSGNHTHFSTWTTDMSTKNNETKSNNYAINNHEYKYNTSTNSFQGVTETNFKIIRNDNLTGFTHLNSQSILDPTKLLINHNNFNIDIEQPTINATKNRTNHINNITALNESNFMTVNRKHDMENISRESSGDTKEQQNSFSIITIPFENNPREFYDVPMEVNTQSYSKSVASTEFDNITTTTSNIYIASQNQSLINVPSNSYFYIFNGSKTDQHGNIENDTISQVYRNTLGQDASETKLSIPEQMISTPGVLTQSNIYEIVNHTNQFKDITNFNQTRVATDTKTEITYYKTIAENSTLSNIQPTSGNTITGLPLARAVLPLETSQNTTPMSMKASTTIIPDTKTILVSSNKSDNKSDLNNSGTVINNTYENLNEQKHGIKITASNSDILLETSTSSLTSYSSTNTLVSYYDLKTTSKLKKGILDDALLATTPEKDTVPFFNDGATVSSVFSTKFNKDSEIRGKKELPTDKINNQYTSNVANYLNIIKDSPTTPVNFPLNTKQTKNYYVDTQSASSFHSIKDSYSEPTIAYVPQNRNDERILKVTTDISLDRNSNSQTYLKDISNQEIVTPQPVIKTIENHNITLKENTSSNQSELISKQAQKIITTTLKKSKEQVTLQFQYSNDSHLSHSKFRPYNMTSLSDVALSRNEYKNRINSTATSTPLTDDNQKINKILGFNFSITTFIETEPINNKHSNNSDELSNQTIKINKNTPKDNQFTAIPTQITRNSNVATLGIICLKHRGKYSDRNNCNKFYICSGETQPLVGKCPANTVFSDIIKQCTKNLSHCIRNNQFQCSSPGRYYDVFSINTYYICAPSKNGYIKFQFQCIRGYTLNKTIVRCIEDYKNDHTSISLSESSNTNEGSKSNENKSEKMVSKVFKCESIGKFPDPTDCRKYYVCSKNNKSEFRRRKNKCDSDEVWNNEKKKCVDEESYECKQI